MFTIEISYKTGNSFGSEDKIENIDFEWENLESIKKSLQRIKNHYKYFEDHIDVWRKPKEKLPEGVVWNDTHRILCLELIDDNGNPFIFHSFWTGYFERLYEARIVATNIGSYRPYD